MHVLLKEYRHKNFMSRILGSSRFHSHGMKPQFLESATNNYSDFYTACSKCVRCSVLLRMWKSRPGRAHQSAWCGGEKAYNDCFAKNCQIGSFHIRASFGKAGGQALLYCPTVCWMDSTFGSTAIVCVYFSGVWYRKTTITGFELVAFKGNVNNVLSRDWGSIAQTLQVSNKAIVTRQKFNVSAPLL